jgi:hypothetical protein
MKPTLVVLAAGLGSRYGSLKQVDTFGPSGESLLDYTIYDAIQVGFGKVVCVIRNSMKEDFVAKITTNFGNRIEIAFAYQTLDDLPDGFEKPELRSKPWGTAHAIWSARDEISTPFCMVNADDFYGRSALNMMCYQLTTMDNIKEYSCMIGYHLWDTLSNYGSVSRGICEIEQGYLTKITECKDIEIVGDHIRGRMGNEYIELSKSTIVSMNLMGFSSSVIEFIEAEFILFLKDHVQDIHSEFYAPSILQSLIENQCQIPVQVTDSPWFGVTYSQDKPLVQSKLRSLIESGIYPKNLFKG